MFYFSLQLNVGNSLSPNHARDIIRNAFVSVQFSQTIVIDVPQYEILRKRSAVLEIITCLQFFSTVFNLHKSLQLKELNNSLWRNFSIIPHIGTPFLCGLWDIPHIT
jgi:hypothetical protein